MNARNNARIIRLLALQEQLITEQNKYIALLTEELTEVIPIAAAHGWTTNLYNRGVNARRSIEKLTNKLNKYDLASISSFIAECLRFTRKG